jgi:hypothetical protein
MDNKYMIKPNKTAELKLAYETIATLHQLALSEYDIPNNIDTLEYADYICNKFYNEVDAITI